MFNNSLGDRGSIPGRVMLKTQKWHVVPFFRNTQNSKVRIKDKWTNPGKRVALFPTPRGKGSLWVANDYGQPTGSELVTHKVICSVG